MIDNFENLVARCNARRRKRIIRLSFFISAVILFAIAAVAAYIQLQTPAKIAEKPKKNLSVSPMSSNTTAETAPAVVAPKTEQNLSPDNILPMRDNAKNRAFVIQLTSGKSFDDINASRRRIPAKYQPSLAVYAINGLYALRYIDIYESESLPNMIQYFKSLGFLTPTAYKYNPERIPLSENDVIKSNTLPPSASPQTKEIPIQVPVPAAVPETTPVKSVSGNRLFNVQTTAKTTTADLIRTYSSNPKYENALTIANDFYTQGNFADAATWAKKANQLNREDEEAWLLYARSYYAQGRKKEAMGVLELYLNYKDSKAASELLRTWKLTPQN